MNLHAIAYVSTARLRGATVILDAILQDARAMNAKLEITGTLLHHDGNFFQYLEGPPGSVNQVFERIQAARSHHDLVVLLSEEVARRHFSEWAMGFAEATANEMQQLSQARWVQQLQSASAEAARSSGIELLLSFWKRAGGHAAA